MAFHDRNALRRGNHSAGTARLAAERAARKAGANTLLIGDRFSGPTCTTVGCMPSKLLIAAANAA
jgi:dihydrolipoamide dehydrogenase